MGLDKAGSQPWSLGPRGFQRVFRIFRFWSRVSWVFQVFSRFVKVFSRFVQVFSRFLNAFEGLEIANTQKTRRTPYKTHSLFNFPNSYQIRQTTSKNAPDGRKGIRSSTLSALSPENLIPGKNAIWNGTSQGSGPPSSPFFRNSPSTFNPPKPNQNT